MTTALQTWHPLARIDRSDRSDRSVRRVAMRLPAAVSEHRAVSLVEEALRLISLPGEDQGRTYYFRRVALRGISAAAPPREWIDRAQTAMCALARAAVHGSAARAAGSDAVFFNSQQEALEWLLHRLLRSFPRVAGVAEWFAPMIAPAAHPNACPDATMQAVTVIERLRSLPSGWFAAATVLLDLVEGSSGAWPVLESIPARVLGIWLRELGGASSSGSRQAPRISPARRRILLTRLSVLCPPALHRDPANQARARTGPAAQYDAGQEPPLYLVWLAALAVLAEDPTELARGLAVADGRAVIEELAGSPGAASSNDPGDAESPASLVKREAPHAVPGAEQEATSAQGVIQGVLDQDLPERVHRAANTEPAADQSLFTSAGGLYFLLNVLRSLGIEAAIEALPSPLRIIFLPRLIDALARAATVPRDDASLLWVTSALASAGPDLELGAAIAASECWPRTLLAAPPDRELTLSRLIRVWMLAIRRWCWRSAQLTLRETVLRSARILLTRTDVDVTLPMDAVDLRIRKIGLDLDPGWLPWFGRVVRFHYVYELSRRGADGGASA